MNMCVVALLHRIMKNHEEDRNIQNPRYDEEITNICMIVKTSNDTNIMSLFFFTDHEES